MKTKGKKGRVLLLAALVMTAGGFAVTAANPAHAETTPPSDAGITPILVEGNTSCSALRPGTIELKTDPPDGSTLTDGYATINYTFDGVTKEVTWSSNVGIDLVFVKGGPAGNNYVYDPPTELTSDGGLYPPINPNNGDFYGLSHISFCYDLELEVSKTAVTTFDRDWDWTVEKNVDTAVLDLFDGESGHVTWEVIATKTGPTDSNFAVHGDITIHNPAATAASVTGVTDSISGIGNVTVSCAPSGLSFVLLGGETKVCTYSSALPNADSRVNTATVTTSGAIGGSSGTANVVFDAPTNETDATATASDTNGQSFGPLSASQTFHYDQTFECSTTDGDGTDAGLHVNTVTITGGDNDSAETTVNCYGLTVSKTANTHFRRTFDWTLNKTANFGSIVIMPNDVLPVTFTVTVNTLATDTNFGVTGLITVHNPAPISVDLVGVADSISGVGNAVVDCGVTFPYTLGAGQDLVCGYLSALPNATARTNTATATTEFGVSYSGTAAVSFVGADVESIARCVSLTDSNYPVLAALFDAADGTVDGQYCVAAGATSASFSQSYTLDLSFPNCGPTQYSNTVDLSTGATKTVIIPVNVPCATGCTLTIGYWKTHSTYGPAKKADPAWFLIGDKDGDGVSEGPNETFFLSGKTWYQVFNTSPAGNPYYIAAVQYMGAVLNQANGASSTPAVTSALAAAKTFFQTYGPGSSWTKAQKTQLTDWGTLFNSYNTGAVGPGHCSEII